MGIESEKYIEFIFIQILRIRIYYLFLIISEKILNSDQDLTFNISKTTNLYNY